MTENTKRVEQHGCIVCGRIHQMLVVTDPAGRLVDCTPTGPGARRIPDDHRPLVACTSHTQAQVDTALARHYPGRDPKDPDEE